MLARAGAAGGAFAFIFAAFVAPGSAAVPRPRVDLGAGAAGGSFSFAAGAGFFGAAAGFFAGLAGGGFFPAAGVARFLAGLEFRPRQPLWALRLRAVAHPPAPWSRR